jgi:hypothetical protein
VEFLLSSHNILNLVVFSIVFREENNFSKLIMSSKEDNLIARAKILQQAIAMLQLIIQQIKAGGEIAPPCCCVSRYQARGK